MPLRRSSGIRLCAVLAGICALLILQEWWIGVGSPMQEGAPVGPGLRGDVLRLISEAPRSLDPAEADSVYESIPLNQIFNGLVSVDPGMHVLPSLAHTWTISRDGRVYIFHLRPGVLFHDGSPLTADDVVFTIRRLLSPARSRPNVACSYLQIVEGADAYMAGKRKDLPGVVAEGPLTLRVSLARPYMSFLEVLAMDGLKIVPRAAIERMGEAAFGRAPVGTGPFRLAVWDPEHLALEANPSHFGEKPFLQRVDIAFYRPTETDAGAFRFGRGEIDVLEVQGEDLARISSDPNVHIRRYQDLNLAFMGVSRKHAPFDDLRVRQAVASAVNRDRIVGASPHFRRGAIGILPPGMQAYSPEPKALAYDPDKARRLLAEAGYPGGRGLPVVPLYCGASRTSIRVTAEMIRADLAAVGITVEVRQVPWRELSRLVDDQEAPLFLLNWLADLSDPDSFLRSLFESGGSSNYFAYRDEETEKLLAAGASETNPVLRARIYRRIEHQILQQAPLVPLYHPVNHLAVRADVLDFTPGPLGVSSVNFGRVRIARARPM